MVFQDHKPGSEDRCLEEGGQAQANDLLAPLHEPIHVTARYREHIE